MGRIDELLEELEALKRLHPDRSKFDAAWHYRSVHLRLAEALESQDPIAAVEQYWLAEECQATIGTYSTGSGEGIASMMELYDIMAQRAELEERIADSSSDAEVKRAHLQGAMRVWMCIRADPNQFDMLPQKDLVSLQAKIDELE